MRDTVKTKKGAAKVKEGARVTVQGSQELASGLSGQARAAVDERAAKVRESDAYAKGQEIAARTGQRVREAGLDERAGEVAAKLREAELIRRALETANTVTDRQLERLGRQLAAGRVGERLGLQPPKRKRRFPWLAAALGAVCGYAAGMLTAPERGEELRGTLSQRVGVLGGPTGTAGQAMGPGLEARDPGAETPETMVQSTPDLAAPPAEKPLEDRIRTKLGQDPRTSDLPSLNINVVEGTVFVRGSVPEDFDREQIRAVVADVEGVTDVDLQV